MINNLIEKAKKLKNIALMVGGVYLSSYIALSLACNREYISSDICSIKRIDFDLSMNSFLRRESTGGEEPVDLLFKGKVFGSNYSYYDGDIYGKRDGLVDFIKIEGGIFKIMDFALARSVDYENNKQVFDKADKDLEAAKKRFKVNDWQF